MSFTAIERYRLGARVGLVEKLVGLEAVLPDCPPANLIQAPLKMHLDLVLLPQTFSTVSFPLIAV